MQLTKTSDDEGNEELASMLRSLKDVENRGRGEDRDEDGSCYQGRMVSGNRVQQRLANPVGTRAHR